MCVKWTEKILQQVTNGYYISYNTNGEFEVGSSMSHEPHATKLSRPEKKFT